MSYGIINQSLSTQGICRTDTVLVFCFKYLMMVSRLKHHERSDSPHPALGTLFKWIGSSGGQSVHLYTC